MSVPAVNPALTTASTAAPAVPTTPATTSAAVPTTPWGFLALLLASFGGFFAFLLHAAAAKLSYDKYQSIGWAFLDFIFGSVYIPYYAFFLNTPTSSPTSILGGRRRR